MYYRLSIRSAAGQFIKLIGYFTSWEKANFEKLRLAPGVPNGNFLKIETITTS